MRLRRLTEEEMHKNDQVLNHVVYRMFSNNDNSKSGENPMYYIQEIHNECLITRPCLFLLREIIDIYDVFSYWRFVNE